MSYVAIHFITVLAVYESISHLPIMPIFPLLCCDAISISEQQHNNKQAHQYEIGGRYAEIQITA